MVPTQGEQDRPAAPWRTPAAIASAVAAGVPGGLFLHASAVPFGPVLFGWVVALLGAVVLTAGLGVLATDRYVTVGVGCAAGVAAAAALADVWTAGIGVARWGPVAQFGVVFSLVAFASLFGSLPCA